MFLDFVIVAVVFCMVEILVMLVKKELKGNL